jgi:hypothetical protein
MQDWFYSLHGTNMNSSKPYPDIKPSCILHEEWRLLGCYAMWLV